MTALCCDCRRRRASLVPLLGGGAVFRLTRAALGQRQLQLTGRAHHRRVQQLRARRRRRDGRRALSAGRPQRQDDWSWRRRRGCIAAAASSAPPLRHQRHPRAGTLPQRRTGVGGRPRCHRPLLLRGDVEPQPAGERHRRGGVRHRRAAQHGHRRRVGVPRPDRLHRRPDGVGADTVHTVTVTTATGCQKTNRNPVTLFPTRPLPVLKSIRI